MADADASRYWRITGYFTSRSLLQVLEGVEQLVAASPDGIGHGQMRLITGVFLSENDIAALTAGATAETVLTDHLSNNFPFKGVEPGGQGAAALGAELLAWLVDNGHLEIRVGLPLIDGLIVNDHDFQIRHVFGHEWDLFSQFRRAQGKLVVSGFVHEDQLVGIAV